MNEGQIVFSQITDHLPMQAFHRCVQRYRGHYKVQSFSCLDQFLCMAFAQLTYRDSLRDIEAGLRAQQSKLYHMGIAATSPAPPWPRSVRISLSHSRATIPVPPMRP